MREEVLSRVEAQDTDTRGYEVSDLEDIDFSWVDLTVDMDSVHQPGIDTPFSPSILDDFEMGSTAANPIIVDHEEDMENSAPTTTTPKSERPIVSHRLLRSHPLKTGLENVSDSINRTLFRYTFYVFVFYTL